MNRWTAFALIVAVAPLPACIASTTDATNEPEPVSSQSTGLPITDPSNSADAGTADSQAETPKWCWQSPGDALPPLADGAPGCSIYYAYPSFAPSAAPGYCFVNAGCTLLGAVCPSGDVCHRGFDTYGNPIALWTCPAGYDGSCDVPDAG